MKYLRMLMLPLALLLVVSCEDEVVVDCDALTTTYVDATTAWTNSMDTSTFEFGATECAAMVAAYKAGLDGGCAGYTQAGLDVLNTAENGCG
jgi:hypothetical protein